MENLPPADDQAKGLEEAFEQFTAVLTQAEASRLAGRASERFLQEFSQELSTERELELLLKALTVYLRSYAEQGCVEPKLASVLQQWWGKAEFKELGQALRLFARSAESRGAERARMKMKAALPQLVEQRLSKGKRHAVVVGRRSKILTMSACSTAVIASLTFTCMICGMFIGLNFVPCAITCERGSSLEIRNEVLQYQQRSLFDFE
ncbi:MAG: hypothetical protein AB4040_16415 [Synechococcus sp.]